MTSTCTALIDAPSDEERKVPYVLSRHDETVLLLSYVMGCMMGGYSSYVDSLLFAGD